jgi:hypothetical protein
MRVVVFSQFFPPEIGAAQTRLETFARTLADSGHDVTVIAEVPNHPKGIIPPEWRGRFFHRTREHGYEVLRVWVHTAPRMTFWRRLAWYVTYAFNAVVVALATVRRRPAVVFASSPPLPVLASALVVAALWRRPLVVDVRDIWPAVGIAMGELRGRPVVHSLERLERVLYRRAAGVTCATPGFVEHVIEKGAEPGKVHLLPNGTLPEVFRPDRRDPNLRKSLGLENDAFVVGYVGMLGIAQGLPTILDAAELLAGDVGIRFLFVGDGTVKEGLVASAKARGLNKVVFADQVAVEEAVKFINVCDVLLVPLARVDVFKTFIPSKLFDYLSCEKPVVVMADGEARQLVEESGTGIFVEPGNPDELAKAVISLRDDAPRLQAMASRGRPFACAAFDRNEISRRLEMILSDVVASSQYRSRRTLR